MNRFLALFLWLGIGQLATAAPPSIGESFPLPVDRRCTLSLGSDLVDYGTLSRWQLREMAANTVSLGKRTLTLSVACPYSQNIRLAMRGERTADGNLRYGERGSLKVHLSDVQLDGQPVQIVGITPNGAIHDMASDSRWLQPGQTFAPGDKGRMARGKVLIARIEIEPLLPEADARVGSHKSSEARLGLELMD